MDAQTGEEVADEDRVKGFKTRNDDYILIEDDEFEEVALESTHTIDIDKFVPRDEVDEIYLNESYYIVPQDKIAREPFAVIREAMRSQEMVGIARVVLHRREHVLMLSPRGKGILATVLRYRDEVRDAGSYFDDIPNIKVAADMLELAGHIVAQKSGHFNPDEFEDRYEKALRDLIRAKQSGQSPPPAPSPQPSNVINLMDALRRSVKSERRAPSRRGTRAKSPRRRAATTRRRKLKKAS